MNGSIHSFIHVFGRIKVYISNMHNILHSLITSTRLSGQLQRKIIVMTEVSLKARAKEQTIIFLLGGVTFFIKKIVHKL